MEILRLVRNRRVLIFSMLMPAMLLLIFGGLYKKDSLNGASAAAYLMVSMGLFGVDVGRDRLGRLDRRRARASAGTGSCG